MTHPFEALGPDLLLDAVESVGLVPDGRFLALNSYENRVYQIGIENQAPLVAKFYRPERWSTEAILDEHDFSLELAGHEIPVVAPLRLVGSTLHEHRGFRFALFPRRGGRAPELDDTDTREWLGRFLGRIHAVGEARGFTARPRFGLAAVREDRDWLLAEHWIPDYLVDAYRTLSDDLLLAMAAAFERAGDIHMLRLHGDCHPGNVLWTEQGPHFVDLDDCATGPAVQDLWMLLSGEREERSLQLSDVIAGYEDFRDFDRRELHLVEALRTARVMRYAAWLARRWDDPAFPLAFPWFGEPRFWEQHLLDLREQAAALQEPPLAV
jgi:Ser/Thr protein kinase RdoA (MazF antagonist)